VTGQVIPFNPLDKKNLGASVAEAMLARPVVPLGAIPSFKGAGIYAIYYTGALPMYERLAEQNRNGRFAAPIYVGKAVPSGARKGGVLDTTTNTSALCSRLREHADSIREVPGLRIEDFHCRFLAVDDIWIPLGESLLIAKFSPVWNSLADGFGNHDPGKGRYSGMRPRWDVLHPGRSWAPKCRERPETAQDIEREVENYLRVAVFPLDQRLISPNAGQPDVPAV
jgi:hypothetical protein